MAWLDDIVGDWNDTSGNHYQVGLTVWVFAHDIWIFLGGTPKKPMVSLLFPMFFFGQHLETRFLFSETVLKLEVVTSFAHWTGVD